MPTANHPVLSDPATTRRLLWPRLRRYYPGSTGITRLVVHHLGSVQAGRGVVRLRVTLSGRPRRSLLLFANYDVLRSNREIFSWLTWLARHGFSRPPFLAPRPLFALPVQHLLVYEAVGGVRVRDQIEAGRLGHRGLLRVMRQAGWWLKKFHRLPVGVGRRRIILPPRPRWLNTPVKIRTQLLRSQRLTTAALRQVRRSSALSLVHGDPHLANAIRGHRGTFAFIDYSESYRGDALADIGMFLVHLEVALHPYYPPTIINQARRVFTTAYFGRTLERTTPDQRRAVVAYQALSAMTFWRFTANHHQHPSPYARWMMRRFKVIMERSARYFLDPRSSAFL